VNGKNTKKVTPGFMLNIRNNAIIPNIQKDNKSAIAIAKYEVSSTSLLNLDIASPELSGKGRAPGCLKIPINIFFRKRILPEKKNIIITIAQATSMIS
jgi:hypothetical protein